MVEMLDVVNVVGPEEFGPFYFWRVMYGSIRQKRNTRFGHSHSEFYDKSSPGYKKQKYLTTEIAARRRHEIVETLLEKSGFGSLVEYIASKRLTSMGCRVKSELKYRSVKEVAEKFQVSQARVKQILDAAVIIERRRLDWSESWDFEMTMVIFCNRNKWTIN